MDERTKITLDESEIPRQWYNVVPDLPSPQPPPLHPGTLQPVGPEDLAPLFPMELIRQEVSGENWVPIPDEVVDVYRLWRPTPLFRARRLEKALGTRPGSTTSTRESPRPARTSRTPRSPRRSTTRPKAPSASPPRPAPASGAARSRSPAHSTASAARSGWCAPPTTRSRIAAR